MTVIDNKPNQLLVIDKNGNVQYGFSQQITPANAGDSISTASKAIVSSAVLKAYDGINFKGLVTENGHTSGYGLQVFNSIGGAAQYGLNARMSLTSFGASDGVTTGTNSLKTSSSLWGFNGTSFDRLRSVNTGQLVITVKDSSGSELGMLDDIRTDVGYDYVNSLSVLAGIQTRILGSSKMVSLALDDDTNRALYVSPKIAGIAQYGFNQRISSITNLIDDVNPVGWAGNKTVSALYAYNNSYMRRVRLDADDNLKVTNVTHTEANIHQSKVFRAGHLWTSVSAGSTVYFEITTPATDVHFTPIIQANGEVEIEFLEAPSFTTGTSITPVNADRNSSSSSSCTVSYDPTSVSGGTTLGKRRIGSAGTSGFFGSASYGGSVTSDEWLLKQSTSYLIKMTNNESSAIYIQTFNQWIEG